MDTDPSPDTDAPSQDAAQDATTAEVVAATDGTDAGDGTYVPPLLLVVFGLPIFLTLIWFFLRFTAPDRFGRVDRDLVDDDDDDGSDEPPTEPALPEDPPDRPA